MTGQGKPKENMTKLMTKHNKTNRCDRAPSRMDPRQWEEEEEGAHKEKPIKTKTRVSKTKYPKLSLLQWTGGKMPGTVWRAARHLATWELGPV